MASGALYAFARVKAKEAKFVGAERLNRMLEGNAEDALKVINETSYAEGSATVGDTRGFQKMLDFELYALIAFFAENCPDERVKRCFLSEYDYLNAKALVKAKFSKSGNYADMVYEKGLIPLKTLAESIYADNYVFLPQPMANALKAADISYAGGGANPGLWDAALNKAMYEDISAEAEKSGDKNIIKYFSLKADTENLLTAVKCRLAGLSVNEFEKQYVTGGSIARKAFEGAVTAPADSAAETLRHTSVSALADKGFKYLSAASSIAPLERDADNTLNMYFAAMKNMQDTAYPLINYYLIKLAEIKNVKMIFTGLLGGAAKADMKERMRAV